MVTQSRSAHARTPGRHLGFTLVEVLVALVILSLIALMSWRALDTLVRSETLTQQHANDNQRLQTALAQWRADLNAMASGLQDVEALAWDGRVLRITRRSEAGPSGALRVVAWSLLAQAEGPVWWVRWASPEVNTHPQWRAAWDSALQVARGEVDSPDAAPLRLMPATQWQLFYNRERAWTNPLSSADGAENPPERQTAPPDAVRLQLWPQLPGLSEPLTLDWLFPQH